MSYITHSLWWILDQGTVFWVIVTFCLSLLEERVTKNSNLSAWTVTRKGLHRAANLPTLPRLLWFHGPDVHLLCV